MPYTGPMYEPCEVSVEEQAEMARRVGIDRLMYCGNAWAMRHRLANRATGEVRRARCNSWSCSYCGPRKVDRWRKIIELAQPTLFVTLSRAGHTVEEAARTLTTVMQYLRRGSKGRSRGRVGAREAYPIEFFATLEEHTNREDVGFHWHLLVRGVEYLPKEVVKEALRSATKHLYPGGSYIVDVRRVRNLRAVGYVTKYLTKDVQWKERGVVQQERQEMVPVYVGVPGTEYMVRRMVCQEDGTVQLVEEQAYGAYSVQRDEQGREVREERHWVEEKMSKAHRVRYSKQFFPGKTADLWRFICEGKGLEDLAALGGTLELLNQGEDSGKSVGELVGEECLGSGGAELELGKADQGEASGWMLCEVERVEAPVWDYRRVAEEAYERMRRRALVEALEDMRAGKRPYSRRVLSIWKYQQARAA